MLSIQCLVRRHQLCANAAFVGYNTAFLDTQCHHTQVGQQVHLPFLLNHSRDKLHIGSVTSHSIQSPPEIEKAEGFSQ